MITERQCGLAMPAALAAGRIATWYKPLVDAMTAKEITTPNRISYFLANVAEETGQLQARSENLNYSGDRLMAVFPSLFNGDSGKAYALAAQGPEAIANYIYADANRPRGYRMGNVQPGDGWKFRGRGPMELTGRQNYEHFFNSIGAPVNSDPDLLLTPKYGALSAAQFWADADCNIMADVGNFTGCVVKINGGTTNIGTRQNYLKRFQDALAHPDPVAPVVVQPVAVAPIVLPDPVEAPAVTSADFAVVVPPMPLSITIHSEPTPPDSVPEYVPPVPAPVEVSALKLDPVMEPIAPMSPVPPQGYSVQPGGNIMRDDVNESVIVKASKAGQKITVGLGVLTGVSAGLNAAKSTFVDLFAGIDPLWLAGIGGVTLVGCVVAYFIAGRPSKARIQMHNNGIA